jgi:hypothetical protein
MKYTNRLTREICVRISKLQRKRFSEIIEIGEISKFKIHDRQNSKFINMVSFSSGRDIEEQVLSILSFLHWVGQPNSWTIYSDGTHSKQQIEILESLGKFIFVKPWNQNINNFLDYKDCLVDYASQYAMGKKMCAYSGHIIDSPTIFLDSDIVFYQKSSTLLDVALNEQEHWFLADVGWGCLDSNYKELHTREMFQLNGGFFLILPGFSWESAFDFIKSIKNKFEYFTEQTATHIAMREQGGKPFDPREFIITCSDQFNFKMSYAPSEIALRHYVNPVRHKMWQFGWEWHIS